MKFVNIFNVADMTGVNEIRSHARIGAGIVLPVVETGQEYITAPQKDAKQDYHKDKAALIKAAGSFQVKESAGISQKEERQYKHLCIVGAVKKSAALCKSYEQAGQDNRKNQAKACPLSRSNAGGFFRILKQ